MDLFDLDGNPARGAKLNQGVSVKFGIGRKAEKSVCDNAGDNGVEISPPLPTALVESTTSLPGDLMAASVQVLAEVSAAKLAKILHTVPTAGRAWVRG